jgi:protein-S-isoprenylcysteine O-methyltransferase Ste14
MRMLNLPFSVRPILTAIFFVACAAWILPEVVAWRVKRSSDSSHASDHGSLNLIVILWSVGITMAVLISLLLPQAAMSWKRTSVFLVGIFFMLMGAALRWYSAAILGKYFTFDVAIQGGQTLIEAGPYRYVRHPSYSGALLSLLGFGLALGNWAGLAAALSCLGFAYSYRIPIEEQALSSALGDVYIKYMTRTWRLIPFLF